MKRALRGPILGLAFLLPLAAVAAEHEIAITHMELESVEGDFRQGDTVRFINRADITHNLYLTYEDGSMTNLDTQVPGTERSAVLEHEGKVLVRCWIHPIIRLEIQAKARTP